MAAVVGRGKSGRAPGAAVTEMAFGKLGGAVALAQPAGRRTRPDRGQALLAQIAEHEARIIIATARHDATIPQHDHTAKRIAAQKSQRLAVWPIEPRIIAIERLDVRLHGRQSEVPKASQE